MLVLRNGAIAVLVGGGCGLCKGCCGWVGCVVVGLYQVVNGRLVVDGAAVLDVAPPEEVRCFMGGRPLRRRIGGDGVCGGALAVVSVCCCATVWLLELWVRLESGSCVTLPVGVPTSTLGLSAPLPSS